MEWWEWGTWGLALITGAGGLVLGIRAERRANRYQPHWTPEGGERSMTFYNRTGEDAMDVRLDIAEGWYLANYRPYGVVEPNATATFATVKHMQSDMPFAGLFRWTRASTGREYRIFVGNSDLAQALGKSNPPPRRVRWPKISKR